MSKVTLDLAEATVAASEEGSDRRRSLRAELIVRVDYSTIDEIFSEFTSDINEGGLFIETDSPRPVGTEVAMYFNLPGTADSIRTVGTVVRVSTGDESSPPGMGVEFDDLTEEASLRIDEIVRALRTDSAA